MSELRVSCLLYVLKEAVDGAPGVWEFVTDLEEEFVGNVETARGEFRVKSGVFRVLLLVKDGTDSEKMVWINWRWRLSLIHI